MTKIPGLPAVRTQRRYKGAFQTMEYADGRIAARAPQPKGLKVTSPVQKAQNEAFGWACKATTWAIDFDRIAAEEGSKGTPWLPRDILVAAMYGTLVTVVTRDGRTFGGARLVAADIQALLNQITDTPGAILVRGEDSWIGLGPGTATQVLTAFGSGLIPQWADNVQPNVGGYTPAMINQAWAAANAENFCCQATQVQPSADIDVAAVYVGIVGTAGLTMKAFIGDMTTNIASGVIGTRVTQGPTIAAFQEPNWYGYVRLPLTAPITLAAGSIYTVGATRQDGTAFTKLPIYQTGNNLAVLPAPVFTLQSLELASLNPAPGAGMTFKANRYNPFAIGLDWKLH